MQSHPIKYFGASCSWMNKRRSRSSLGLIWVVFSLWLQCVNTKSLCSFLQRGFGSHYSLKLFLRSLKQSLNCKIAALQSLSTAIALNANVNLYLKLSSPCFWWNSLPVFFGCLFFFTSVVSFQNLLWIFFKCLFLKCRLSQVSACRICL